MNDQYKARIKASPHRIQNRLLSKMKKTFQCRLTEQKESVNQKSEHSITVSHGRNIPSGLGFLGGLCTKINKAVRQSFPNLVVLGKRIVVASGVMFAASSVYGQTCSNLVTNGDFTTNLSGWTATGAWGVEGSRAANSANGVNNQTLTQSLTGLTNGPVANQVEISMYVASRNGNGQTIHSATLEVLLNGTLYASFTNNGSNSNVSATASGGASLNPAGGFTAGGNFNGGQTYTITIPYSGPDTADLQFRFTASNNGQAGGLFGIGAIPAAGDDFAIDSIDVQGDCGPPPVCGDNTVEGSEECDDGNLVNNDGCTSTCLIDSDFDGIADTIDKDDDNDGITDVIEGFSLALGTEVFGGGWFHDNNGQPDGFIPTDGNPLSSNGLDAGPGVTETISNNGAATFFDVNGADTSSFTAAQAAGDYIGGSITPAEDLVISELRISRVSNQNTYTAALTYFDGGGTEVLLADGLTVTSGSNSVGIPTSENVFLPAGQPVDIRIYFYSAGANLFVDNMSLSIRPVTATEVDSDGDGIFNRLDLDSDGDGCPDAVEGSGDFTISNLVASGLLGGNSGGGFSGSSNTPVSSNLGTTVDTNPNSPTCGVPIVAPNTSAVTQGLGTSQNGGDSSACPAGVCGDGLVNTGEECDDGNTADSDGCSSSCAIESGFDCAPIGIGTGPSICVSNAVCGDGAVTAGEECDDGNTVNGDGCSSTCVIEAGFECFLGSSLCCEFGLSEPSGGDGLFTIRQWNLTSLGSTNAFYENADPTAHRTEITVYGDFTTPSGSPDNTFTSSSAQFDDTRNGGEYYAIEGFVAIPANATSIEMRVTSISNREQLATLHIAMNGGVLTTDEEDLVLVSWEKNRFNGTEVTVQNYTVPSSAFGTWVRMSAGVSDGTQFSETQVQWNIDGAGFEIVPAGAFSSIAAGPGPNATCAGPICGDGVVLTSSGEECDDGNTIDGDGCSGTCVIEAGFLCDPVLEGTGPSICAAGCAAGQTTGLVHATSAVVAGGTSALNPENSIGAPDGQFTRLIGGDSVTMELLYIVNPGDAVDVVLSSNDDVDVATITSSIDGVTFGDPVIYTSPDTDLTTFETVSYPVPSTGLQFIRVTRDSDTVNVDGIIASVCQGCGNGIVEGVEGCDDGNLVDSDGCSSSCVIESGAICTFTGLFEGPSACFIGCAVGETESTLHAVTATQTGGASSVANAEGAPDGLFSTLNANDVVTMDFVDTIEGGRSVEVVLAANSTDPAGTITSSLDGVTFGNPLLYSSSTGTNTAFETINYPVPAGGIRFIRVSRNEDQVRLDGIIGMSCDGCGNGTVEAGESCDDGNTVNSDGCSSTCAIETGFSCNNVALGESSACVPQCLVCHTASGIYSFGGSFFDEPEAKLLADQNFGPGGTVGVDIVLQPLPTDGSINEALLNSLGCDIVHLGLGPNSDAGSTTAITISQAESQAVRAWSEAPGNFAIVNQGHVVNWGYTNVQGNSNPNTLQPEFTFLSDGPFGEVTTFVQSGGFQGSVFGGPPLLNCEVTLDDQSRSSIVYDSSSGDILLGDVDILSDLSLSGTTPAITNANDILMANLFAFACAQSVNEVLPPGCPIPDVCGNSLVEIGEECDDGNTDDSDGCSSVCVIEPGFVCVSGPDSGPCTTGGPGSVSLVVCGDSLVDGAEECDDGNTADSDGCSSTCVIEPGFGCPDGTAAPCGDGQPPSPDTDGDGIIDLVDLDDDNDGILDSVECPPMLVAGGGNTAPVPNLTQANLTFTDGGSADEVGDVAYYTNVGTFDGVVVDLRMTVIANPDASLNIDIDGFTQGIFFPILLSGGTNGSEVTMLFEYIDNATGLPTAVFSQGTWVDIDSTAPGEAVILDTTDVVSYTVDTPTSIVATDADGRITFTATTAGTGDPRNSVTTLLRPITQFEASFRKRGGNTGYSIQSEIFDNPQTLSTSCTVDSDMDGIVDTLDLDSDGDGCPDALEGAGSFATTDLVSSSLPGGNSGTAFTGSSATGVSDNLGTTVDTDSASATFGVPIVSPATTATAQAIGDSQDGATLGASCPVAPVVCGNGSVETGEECDDGNTANGDGCSATCSVEPNFSCSGTGPSVCVLGPLLDLNSTASNTDADVNFNSQFIIGCEPLASASVLDSEGDAADGGLVAGFTFLTITPTSGLPDGADEILQVAGVDIPLDADFAQGGVTIPGTSTQVDISYRDGVILVSEQSSAVISNGGMDALIRSVTYSNTNSSPSSAPDRTFDFQVAQFDPASFIIDFEELTPGSQATAAQIGSDPYWADAAALNGMIQDADNAGQFNQVLANNGDGTYLFHNTLGNVPDDERIVFGRSNILVEANQDYLVSIDIGRQNSVSSGPFEVLINGNSVGIINVDSGPVQDWQTLTFNFNSGANTTVDFALSNTSTNQNGNDFGIDNIVFERDPLILSNVATATVAVQNGVCPVAAVCGNGSVETSEECDDGNTANGDGCSSSCIVESGFGCSPTTVGSGPSVCDVDTDDDGIQDSIDLDDDNDGIPDTVEGGDTLDTDGDGIPNRLDLDSDNDGLTDIREAGYDDPENDGVLNETDGVDQDGLVGPADTDDSTADAANITVATGTAENDVDTADFPLDEDGDNVPNFLDLDSDNDGIRDLYESGLPNPVSLDADNDGTIDFIDGPTSDPDGDGILVGTDGTPNDRGDESDPTPANTGPVTTDLPDYLNISSDGTNNDIDSSPFGGLDTDDNGRIDDPTDSDGDGIPDNTENPSDVGTFGGGASCGDGVVDTLEGCDDGNTVDGDGCSAVCAIESGFSCSPVILGSGPSVCSVDTDGDGIPDDIDLDDDNDGISDFAEQSTALNNGDTDGDGISDSLDLDADGDGILDINESGLSPEEVAILDSNGDGVIDTPVGNNGLADGVELNDGPFPIVDYDNDGNSDQPQDTDGDGTPDFQDLDSDNDGIHDLVEEGNLDPAVVDTNNDGVLDNITADADEDGVPDSIDTSLTFGTDNEEPVDTDGDNVPDFRDLDSDNDGIHDLVEGGQVDPAIVDTDNDGVLDDPLNDMDGDGIPDSGDSMPNSYGDPQVGGPFNSDNDPLPDFRDLDSDNDSIPDVTEGRKSRSRSGWNRR